MKKEAVRRITLRFAIHEIMNAEKIEVSDDQINDEMKKIPEINPENLDAAKAQITNSLRIAQLFDRFIN